MKVYSAEGLTGWRRLCLFLLFILFIPSFSEARSVSLPSRYVLYGTLSLEYERDWVSNSSDEKEYITQNYQIGLTGPIIDPRLAAFSIDGTYTDKSGDVESTLKGVNLNLRLLNFSYARGERFQFLNYLPRPIILRYSRYNGEGFTNTAYGLSTGYYLPFYINLFGEGRIIGFKSIYAPVQRLKFNQQINTTQNANGNANGNAGANGNANQEQQQVQQVRRAPSPGILIPFPVIDFDFDKNIYKAGSDRQETTSYDTRMTIGGRRYNYSLNYYVNINEDSRSPYDRKEGMLQLDTRNDLSSWILENRLRYEKREEFSTYTSSSIDSRISRYFQSSPETNYYLMLGAGYRHYESSTGTTDQRSLTGSATRGSRITPYLYSNTGLFVSYQENEEDSGGKKDFYSINLSQFFNYTGYRGVILTGGFTGGYSEETVPYSASIGFITTKWRRFSLSGNYQYEKSLNNKDNTETEKHQIRYGANALILNNLSLNATVGHTIALVDNSESYSERTNRLDIGLKWFYKKQSLDISGYVSEIKSTNPAVSERESSTYGYRIFYNNSLMRRTLFSVSFTQDFDSLSDKTVSDLRTAFSWYYGKLLFTADYEAKRTEQRDSDITEHKLFLKLSRYFRKVL